MFRPSPFGDSIGGLVTVNPLDLTQLSRLIERSRGRPDVGIGVVDGPVALSHPALSAATTRGVGSDPGSSCTDSKSLACRHGTMVVGILRTICPGCTYLLRRIFDESILQGETSPTATPDILADAIVDTVRAGARVINMSVALARPSSGGARVLEQALDFAARHGTIVVAAAGNQSAIGSTAILRHPWVIPVAACDRYGRPLATSNFGDSIGKRGLCSPGEGIVSLNTTDGMQLCGGTSAATPFVTGAIALLCSEFPTATAAEVRLAVIRARAVRRVAIVPPVLNAWAAYQNLKNAHEGAP